MVIFSASEKKELGVNFSFLYSAWETQEFLEGIDRIWLGFRELFIAIIERTAWFDSWLSHLIMASQDKVTKLSL